MQVTETLNEGLKHEFTINVPASDLDAKADAKLVDLKDKVKLNGFRPGKVPVSHLKKVYGRSVMAETIDQTIRDTNTQIFTERGFRLATEPKVSSRLSPRLKRPAWSAVAPLEVQSRPSGFPEPVASALAVSASRGCGSAMAPASRVVPPTGPSAAAPNPARSPRRSSRRFRSAGFRSAKFRFAKFRFAMARCGSFSAYDVQPAAIGAGGRKRTIFLLRNGGPML